MKGRLFLIVGPSGVGKDTLIAGALASDPGLHWARRVITRPAAAGGEPYEGVSVAEFQRRQARGEFALHWQAHGLSYGVARAEFAPLEMGRDVLLNGSRAALERALAVFPALRVIQITLPLPMLAERLALRGRESREDITARLERARQPMPEGLPVVEVCNDGTPEAGIARLAQALRG
jgi:ribose 1,5-bisphosphokinase